MGRIYGSASNVTIYLGQPTDDGERFAEAMRYLQYFTETDAPLELPPWDISSFPEIEKSLFDILSRPWFTRIWTVQEAALARRTTLICGDHRVSWNGELQTMRAIVFRIKAAAISPHYFPTVRHISTLDWTPLLNVFDTQMRQAAMREGVILYRDHLDLAFDFRHRKCTEPRDRYFAIFEIIENDQGGKLTIAPDYNVPLEELHQRFINEIRRQWKIIKAPKHGEYDRESHHEPLEGTGILT